MDPVILITAAIAVGALGTLTGFITELFKRAFRRDEDKERTRLRAEILAPSDTAYAYEALKDRVVKMLAEPGSKPSQDNDGSEPIVGDAEESLQINVPATETITAAPIEVIPKDRHAKFAVLLVDYYAYGLTQARMSFTVSLACSLLGGLVLITGVALAIFNATTNGHVYAGVVTSVAGVLTTSIGILFHQQASRALKHMEQQTNKLRQDMKAEQDAAVAVELLDEVSDEELKGRLQAALILRFSGAKLPDIGKPKSTSLADSELNGRRKRTTRAEASQATPTD